MDNNGNDDADIDNDDYAENDSTEDINNVNTVSNGMNTDGNVIFNFNFHLTETYNN